MRKHLFVLATIVVLCGCNKTANYDPNNVNSNIVNGKNKNSSSRVATTKKGIGLSESGGFNDTQLQLLNISWYYNWGLTTAAHSTIPFVPMEWGTGGLSHLGHYTYLLGFNEPDNASQSNLSVTQALTYWPLLVSATTSLGSPAMAGNPISSGSWLQQFMNSTPTPKVDFITVHWYKGVDTARFYSDMISIHTIFNKPIWVTEFAPQTTSSSIAQPTKYSQAQVNRFITSVTRWMNAQSFIERYAWHDSKVGTSAIFTTAGALTPTGVNYAAAP